MVRVTGVALALALGACEMMENKVAEGPVFDAEAHLFLEEVEGEQALGWVRAQNDRTLELLQSDPRYAPYYEEALRIATSRDRIPYGALRNGYVYNFWQDDRHERGLWRRATLASYGEASPQWETILDVDDLASREARNWVYKGVSCLPPENARCLISLSDGGKDAVRQREFDVTSRSFVKDGFDLPEAKTTAVWSDPDSLLVATDWGLEAGTPSLTESGYPFVVKRLDRGGLLANAVEVFRGARQDVGAFPFSLEDEQGRRWLGVVRSETFFTSSYHLLKDKEAAPVRLPLPPKATIQGLSSDRMLATLEQDWSSPDGQSFLAGDLVGLFWSDFLLNPDRPVFERIWRPTSRQAVQGVSVSRQGVLLTVSDNVVLKVARLSRTTSGWTTTDAPLPANGSAGVAFADPSEDVAFLSYEGYLNPDTLFQYDVARNDLKVVKSLPNWFDPSAFRVDQFEVASTDGVRIPYFIVRGSAAAPSKPSPTLLYGYGGFQVSQTPSYSGSVGKLWLEQGGVYVVANIRGGGEFGPAWHQAGLKTNRQIVYDDFIAVAEDLVRRGITTRSQLGVMGGSNGGLLMGVMFTQRPDLFAAVVCQVPLLDMLRYHLLLAGASWMDEYGDPDDPEERAFLERLSPYHNLKPDVSYPEIYFETSTKDDRVHPAHARKMAYRLQELGKPFLYYENIDGGHSAAANQKEAARRAALEFTYLARKLMGSGS
jgi:prolyl oligopeptidase